MNSLNKINDVFNINTDVDMPNTTAPLVNYQPTEIDQEDDFQLARNTLRGLINKNEDVLTELIHISKNSEHPRAFEVAGQLIKTQTEIAKELVGLHKTKKDITKESPQSVKQQNNIVFAGSTSDLMKMINGEKTRLSNGQ